LPIAESQPARVSIAVSDCISVTQSKPAHISKSFAVSCSITVAFTDSNSIAEPKPVAHLGRGA